MSNEKKNENKDEMKVPDQAPKVGRTGYLSRPTTLMGAVTLSSALITKKPVGMGAAVDTAFQDLIGANGLGRAALIRQATRRTTPMAEPRNGAVSAYGNVTGGLDLLMESGIEPLASQARELSTVVFGETRPAIAVLGPRELEVTLAPVHDRLTRSPGLRKQLEAMVKPELIKLLLDRYVALATAVSATTERMRAPVDAKRTTAIVNDAINYFAICVLATARPGDAERSAKAEAVLLPILAHRADGLRRKVRRSGSATAEEAEIEEEDAGDEPVTEPADPPATPS